MHLILLIIASTANAITLQCQFHDSNWGYKCTDTLLAITSRNNRALTEVEGEHIKGRNAEDVLAFAAFKRQIFYMPRELGESFSSLKYISIKSCGLRELTCGDLEQFGERLTYLWLCNNEIEFIDKNLFKNNPNLAILNLIGNKIKFVEPGAITELAFPHSIYFGNNPCFSGSISYDEEGLPDFVAEIESKCTFRFSLLGQFLKLKDENENFVKENEDLNLKLKKALNEVENLKEKFANCETNFEHSGDHESSV